LEVCVARFRLRFLLQEIDVHLGTTFIGRSPDCQVTIEDPLVSRQHARITIDDTGAAVEDLKSRNGVKVNGQPVRGIVKLKDGDRLRIGTQELVFCEIAEGSGPVPTKTTGFLRHCARCRLPYPQEMLACPNCGETMQLEEDTMTGQLGAETSRSWGLQLLLEVLDKALALGRHPDALRALQRVQSQVEERLKTGEGVDHKQMNEVALAALQTTAATRELEPSAWALRVFRRAKAVPSSAVVDEIGSVAVVHAEVQPALEDLVAWLATTSEGPLSPALPRLQQVLAAITSSDPTDDPDQTKSNPALS
jgi:pSer/pThr/pTyr-binding forkhead associated (FHA) protein